MMRAMMSLTLPAVNGTTIVTRCVGKVCAAAGIAADAAAERTAAIAYENTSRLNMVALP
jgi:hypothetical protein